MVDSDTNEEWRTIEGYPDYSISNLGRVRRDTPCRATQVGRILKPRMCTDGYLRVMLCLNTRQRRLAIHRLLMFAFIGPPPDGKPWVDHVNGIKTDNRLCNLEWVSPKENAQRASRLGLLPIGDRHVSRTHPEKVAMGDRHGSKTKPGSRAKGDQNGARLYPERLHRGERASWAKLKEEDVREIRRLRTEGRTLQSLADEYGVTIMNIFCIHARKSWKHVI